MTDLFESAEQKSNAAEFTVSEISGALKRTVEDAYGHVRVRGEISGYRGVHASGHAYFALKDDKARLEAVIWRGVMGKLRFPPEEGMEVIATGKLTTYPGSSKYQIVIEALEPAGAGALMALLEERKRKLAAEGLFDAARKQALPFMPRVIGVVTSPTGAVIRDIIHRISDRFPLHVLVWPVRVQGETSGAEAAAAITGFNDLSVDGDIPRPDVIIVARGGGSLEDLWGFNDEAVVRAAAASKLPVISAVGHETDWTLIDYAADVRAPTPTGAAEMAVPVKAELEAGLASLNARLRSALLRFLDYRRQRLAGLRRALPTADHLLALPRRRYDEAASRLSRALVTGVNQKKSRFEGFSRQLSPYLVMRPVAEKRRVLNQQAARLPRALTALIRHCRQDYARLARRLQDEALLRAAHRSRQALTPLAHRAATAFQHNVARRRQHLEELGRLLKTLSYENVLERGFALVLDQQSVPVRQAQQISGGDRLTLRFADGEAAVTADEQTPAPTAAPAKRHRKPKADDPADSNQGSLF